MICERCGSDSESWPAGAWPFCKGDVKDHVSAHVAVIDDQLEGGARFFDNLGHQPVWIESKTQLDRELAQRNLRIFDDRAFAGDKHLTNSRGYIDAQTLDNARVLLSRGSRQSDDAVRCETFQSSVRELKSLSEIA